jgi:hypothetical protein
MKYMAWATLLPITGMVETHSSDYLYRGDMAGLNQSNRLSLNPGSILLSRGLSDMGVFKASYFKFCTYTIGQIASWLYADFKARGLTVDAGFQTFYAMITAAKVAVASGSVDYIQAMLVQQDFNLPEGIVESLCSTVAMDGDILRVPVVRSLGSRSVVQKDIWMADSTQISSFAPPYYYCYAALFYDAFTIASGGQYYVNNGTTTIYYSSGNWGDVPAPTEFASFSATTPSQSDISKSISKGPLSIPGADPSMGKLNMVMLGYDPAVVSDTNGWIFTPHSLNCYFKKVRDDSQCRLLALLAAPLDVYRLGAFQYETIYCPKFRNNLGVISRADAYANSAVSESSAKYSGFQNFLKDLNERGLGSNSVLAAVGTLGQYAGKLLAVGVHPMLGKVVEVASGSLKAYAESNGNKPASRKANSNARKEPKPKVNRPGTSQGGRGAGRARSGRGSPAGPW